MDLSHDDLHQKMADSVITGDAEAAAALARQSLELGDRKSTRLNSSH